MVYNILIMSDYSTQLNFETYIEQGVAAHAAGDHRRALGCRTYAFYAADTAVEKARALRDGAASHGYLEELDQAQAAAEMSIGLLGDAGETGRELAASRDRYGRVLSRLAIREELHGESPNTMYNTQFAEAWNDLRGTETRAQKAPLHGTPWPFSVDQYRINMAPRYAIDEALFSGRKFKAARIAVRGIGIALLSENPLTPHASQAEMGVLARTKIALKDVVLATGALGAVFLAGKAERPSRRRNLVLKIADNKLMK